MTTTDGNLAITVPTLEAATPVPAAIRGVRVEVIFGPDAGAQWSGGSERVVIGTHRTADLVLTDRSVSRFHLELAIDGGGVALRDLGSKNGTLLDTVEIEACRLHGPAIVTIGGSELRIDLDGELLALVLAPQEQFGGLIGASPAMRLAFTRLEQTALRDGHVLIEGERGTGKDLAAAALHARGTRRDGPLDVIDCTGAVLEVETALFGRGPQPGALERCDGGVVVLDEIGALGRATQRTLVRALEDRAVRRARGDITRTDVRVIALSRRNLRVDVNSDRFAPELFELIAGARIRLPPLRECPEDVPLLVARFLDDLGATGTRAAAQLCTAESIDTLRAAAWPGNVRELRAYIEQAILSEDGPDDGDLALVDSSATLRDARRRWLRHFERAYVSDLLARTGGNVSAAAVLAGVDRVHMHRMITRAGLRDRLVASRDQQ